MVKIKKISAVILTMSAALGLVACGSSGTGQEAPQEAVSQEEAPGETAPEEAAPEEADAEAETEAVGGTLTLAAAASLEKVFTEQMIPMFNEQYPDVAIEGSYDSSGKLQTQIEEGAPVDVFFSAATKQMTALSEEGMIADDTMVELLENKIVMIVPAGNEERFSGFEEIVNADMIAIGDPESVPAGQYAKEALTNLGLWDQVEGRLSLGTNVTEVLNWVAASSAEAGIVYATDAASITDQVSVIAGAPEGSCQKVIYPVAMLSGSQNPEASQAFLDFLQTEEAAKVFEAAGFTMNH